MIKFLDLQKVNLAHKEEIEERLLKTFRSGWYLLGDEVKNFEQNLSKFIGTRHAIGVANGLDALRLIFRAYIEMGVIQAGDEVIVPANTYIASILAISESGLTPVLVEPDIDTYNIDIERIEKKITPKTKAILIVHLYGRAVWSEKLAELAKKYSLKIVEDNAQAIGASHSPTLPESDGEFSPFGEVRGGLRTGNLGNAAGFSFYPGKNLGALGDGGAVTTNDDELATVVRTLANYGSSKKYVFDYQGINSRLDEIQAAVLDVKLKYIDQENEYRRKIAKRYILEITNPKIILPQMPENEKEHIFHLFVIRTENRDKFQNYLTENGIQTVIHYPIPPHKQACYKEFNNISLPITEKIHKEVLSLPISPVMTEEVKKVITTLNNWK
ncbi:MAG: DegT/DnrJ/EryC1/StrS family aminotransferase [Prevotellaceae bacterium]|nr:DegT/DnrJ/EryC1/StrS family aminotransferase [Prevotellaceae bacterium]